MTRRRLSLLCALCVAAAGLVVANPTPAGAVPPTMFAMSSSQQTSVYGQPIDLLASLSGPSGAPTGTIDFFDGASLLCSAISLETFGSVGTATCPTTQLGVGTHSITATYSGDGNYDAAASTDFNPAFTQTVNRAATTTALSASPDPSAYTEPVLLTATITVTAPGGGIVAGFVDFSDGAGVIPNCNSRPVSGGSATCTPAILTPGPHDITATYSGTTNHVGSVGGPEGQTVANAGTTAAVVADDSTTTWNQTVNFTATVSPVAPATLPPSSGTVKYTTDGTTIAGCATRPITNGVSTCAAVALPPGAQTIAVEYVPGAGFDASTSPGVTQTVAPAPVGVNVGGVPDPSSFGEPVTFTATVTSSAGTPAGTVAFFLVRPDSTRHWLATKTLTNGVASTSTNALPVGTHTIQAVYRGADEYAASTATTSQAVRRAATTTALMSSPDPSPAGGRATLRATVNPSGSGGGSPSGSVAFFRERADDTRVWIATAELQNGRATITTTALPVGEYDLVAVYRGGPGHAASTGTTTHRVTAR